MIYDLEIVIMLSHPGINGNRMVVFWSRNGVGRGSPPSRSRENIVRRFSLDKKVVGGAIFDYFYSWVVGAWARQIRVRGSYQIVDVLL